jgi:hypothetical protein
MGLGRGGLVQLHGRSVDPVEARHQQPAPDQGGQRIGGVDPPGVAAARGRCHRFTLRPARVAAGTLAPMNTHVVEHSGTGSGLGGAAPVATEDGPETPEATIDEVDHLLDEVEAALTRLDEGTYGTCTACGTAIDDARLAGDPTILTCGGCDADAPRHEQRDAAVVDAVDFGAGGAGAEGDDDPVAVAGATPGDVEGTSEQHPRPAAEPGPSWA